MCVCCAVLCVFAYACQFAWPVRLPTSYYRWLTLLLPLRTDILPFTGPLAAHFPARPEIAPAEKTPPPRTHTGTQYVRMCASPSDVGLICARWLVALLSCWCWHRRPCTHSKHVKYADSRRRFCSQCAATLSLYLSLALAEWRADHE